MIVASVSDLRARAKRLLETDFLGRRWSASFGTAPIGAGNLIWPNSEEAIARAVPSPA